MWHPKWKWIDREKGKILVICSPTHKWEYEMVLSREAMNYYNTLGCKCGMVALPEMAKIVVSKQDSCPVHGVI